jgi:hypothetical protein
LIGIGKSLAALFVGFHPCREAVVEYEAATTGEAGKESPLAGIRFKTATKGLSDDHRDSLRFWLLMYCLTIATGIPPGVPAKQESVQRVGSRLFSFGNSCRKRREERLFIRLIRE